MGKFENCALLDTQGIDLVCAHIVRALDTGARASDSSAETIQAGCLIEIAILDF